MAVRSYFEDLSERADCRRPQRAASILFRAFLAGLSLLVGIVLPTSARAQTYPLAITDRSLENPEMLHAKNWATNFGLPPVAITRSNAGERWFSIEPERGKFNPTFGNLFTPGTGWVDTAERNHTDLIYTFNTVPAWAAHQPGQSAAKIAPYDIDDHDEKCEAPLKGVTSA